ncbi:MAG: hypothetical protein IPG12_04910 [Saprospiraceae bacterium]|nr:hypothetical protein [Saprospiraceae bacterium]
MKNILILIVFVSIVVSRSNAQIKLDDFGRIVLNTFLPDDITIPTEAKGLLITKLNQITSNNGMGGSESNPRFIITAAVNLGTKDIIAGPPLLVAQNLDITMFVGDALTNTIFSNTTFSLKGVGTNENKAFIEAFKTVNPKSKEILTFLEEGKKKIIAYYIAQCDFIIKDAQTLSKQEKYDDAIYKLSLIPEVCQECYYKCLDTLAKIFLQKINADCKTKLNTAKTKWAAEQNPKGAEMVGNILSTINPMATCQTEVNSFIRAVDGKLKADEKARWQFRMKQYTDKIAMQKEQIRIAEQKSIRDDTYKENQSEREIVLQEKQSSRNFELDRIRVNAYREVAVEFAKNQPKKIIYNNIFWR